MWLKKIAQVFHTIAGQYFIAHYILTSFFILLCPGILNAPISINFPFRDYLKSVTIIIKSSNKKIAKNIVAS